MICPHCGQAITINKPDDLSPEWRERYEERAAIMEHDAGKSFDEANTAALADIVQVMQRKTWP